VNRFGGPSTGAIIPVATPDPATQPGSDWPLVATVTSQRRHGRMTLVVFKVDPKEQLEPMLLVRTREVTSQVPLREVRQYCDATC